MGGTKTSRPTPDIQKSNQVTSSIPVLDYSDHDAHEPSSTTNSYESKLDLARACDSNRADDQAKDDFEPFSYDPDEDLSAGSFFLQRAPLPFPVISETDVALFRRRAEMPTPAPSPPPLLSALMQLLEERKSTAETLLASALAGLSESIKTTIRTETAFGTSMTLLSLVRLLPSYVSALLTTLKGLDCNPAEVLCGIVFEADSSNRGLSWISGASLSEAWIDAESRAILQHSLQHGGATNLDDSMSVEPFQSISGVFVESVDSTRGVITQGITDNTLLTHIAGIQVDSIEAANKVLVATILERLLYITFDGISENLSPPVVVEMTFAYMRNVSSLYEHASPASTPQLGPSTPSLHTPGLVVRTLQIPLSLPASFLDASEAPTSFFNQLRKNLPNELAALEPTSLCSRLAAAYMLSNATSLRLLPHIDPKALQESARE